MICHYPTEKSTTSNFFNIPGGPVLHCAHTPCSKFHYIGNKFREGIRLNREKRYDTTNAGGKRKFRFFSRPGRSFG
jgi:hypothetical protein